MGQRGLLTRLGTGQRALDKVESITEHLKVILNTRAGESATVPDFGLMDLTDSMHQMPQGVHAIQQAIRDVILKYEPRLRSVSVRYAPGDELLVLRFEIVARLKDETRGVVRFQTQMSRGGKFDVA